MPEHHMRVAFRSSAIVSGALTVNVLHYAVATLTDPPNMAAAPRD
jgi:hypothetical protein